MLTRLLVILVLIGRAAAQSAPASPDVQSPADVALSRYAAKQVAGWTVLVHPEAEALDVMRYRRVMAALACDLESVSREIPPDALAAIRGVKIVVTPRMHARDGLSGRGMCYHDSAGWLTTHGLDAARQGVVEICNMEDFLAWRAEQPLMTLHELAHAYHAMIGFDRPDVAAAYSAARTLGQYRGVEYALAGPHERRDAYALTNEREYFAELSEAYFGRNDFFPFTRDDLRRYDVGGFTVVQSLWGLSAAEITAAQGSAAPTGAVK